MPGPAADGGKAPFRSAREDVRAGVGAEGAEGGGSRERPGERRPRQDIVWRNVVLMSLLHLGAVYSLLLIPKAQPLTLLWGKSRRRPLRPGRGPAGPPGLAGRLWRRAVRSPPRSPLASPRAPPLPGLRSSAGIFSFCLLHNRLGWHLCRPRAREGPRVLRRHRGALRRAKGAAGRGPSPDSREGRPAR